MLILNQDSDGKSFKNQVWVTPVVSVLELSLTQLKYVLDSESHGNASGEFS